MAKKKITKAFENMEVINMIAQNTCIKIRDIYEGYVDNSMDDEGGITSMNGKLEIRPKYQRAYIADMTPNWRGNLINSILCRFPINRIYIGKDTTSDDNLEVLDGQQRIKTICDYIKGDFAIKIDGKPFYFYNLNKEKQDAILDYPLDITYCIGNEDGRIAWFKRINQPNAILTPQELRNATYVGEWVIEAKKFFSATDSKNAKGPKKQINDKTDKYYAGNYSAGRSIERSEYLELAIDWLAYYLYPDMRKDSDEDARIVRYMAEHQHDTNADELKEHYFKVIDWVNDIFFYNGTPKKNAWQSVRSQKWGEIYAKYCNNHYTDEQKLHISERTKIVVAYGNAIFQKCDGIYEWVLRGEKEEEMSKFLYLRTFSPADRAARYNQQKGIDPIDGKHYEIEEMDAHHIKSWRSGGDNRYDNCVWLSKENHKKLHAGDLGIAPEELKRMRDAL